jgi:alkane 1-monooxygenase
MRIVKYLIPFLLFGGALLSYHATGLYCWLSVLFSFAFVPLAELLLPANEHNLSEQDELQAKQNKFYDAVLYLAFFLQLVCLFFFLRNIGDATLSTMDRTGRILTAGLLAGIFGINLAHELGHRTKAFEQGMAKILLSTSLYMHFFIEHNRGHHTHVSTPEDPSTAKYQQSLYAFFLQTIPGTYASAWRIMLQELAKKGKGFWSLSNEMLLFTVFQGALLASIYLYFGAATCWYFVLTALIGVLLLEAVNYIEHYGLMREKKDEGRFARVMPVHSWNSNHMLGRILLFELSRHSDHHYSASRKYQILRHHAGAPQMPTGYPGMLILSIIPPLFFWIMDRQMSKYGVLPKKSEPLLQSI